ncbi:outer envelope protein 39, chloroplastic-like [Telopea speciosissima]|uniref:outer envelope protein 39, chloroplastic-like n=1 Tax=Telopea speciosissima TaxID=54955 RepID=UPI001CC52E6F|nr:outer envelope protein 39, chloroplastic-like [Telopea speciosissima]
MDLITFSQMKIGLHRNFLNHYFEPPLPQHSISPEIGVHGLPNDNFSRSGNGGVNLCRLSAGVDLNEPASSNWTSTTSIKFEHVRPINDDGHFFISRDLDGGTSHDSMVVLKQESHYVNANDHSFSQLKLQMEQGIPVLSKWLIFDRFKFVTLKEVKHGPAFFLASLTGGSIVGGMAPYQAFAIGGLGSVRGYREGVVGSGRSCLIVNNELTFPLVKAGIGVGFRYGLRLKSNLGQFQVDYAINAFHQKTVYFGISNVVG